MSEFLSNFHFIRPFVLLLLLLPLGFFWHYARSRGRNSSWAQVCDKNLLDFLLVKGSSVQRRLIVWIGLVGFVPAVAAAAGPSWKKKEIPNLAPENPVMILLNLSTDMAEKDLTPSRLARAKFEISDLLKMIPSAQSGLIVYSDEPFLISPLTDDARLLDNLLPRLTFDLMPGNGDRLDRALELAVEKFKNAGFPQGQIIVFTSDIGERLDLALAAAEKAKASGYPVSVAAITKADGERLRLLAQNGGGLYIPAVSADSDMQKLAERINQNREQQLKETENLRSVWEDYGYYLTLLPALCCLYFFRKGVLVLLFMLAGLQQAQAGFFLNNNQEGLKAFNSQDYAAAAAKFDRSDWKGSSLYRLGDYQKAYEAFAAGDLLLLPDGREVPQAGYFTEPFLAPVVEQGGREWMTVTPSELNTMTADIQAVGGKVAVFGLGLGYYAFMAARKPEVTRVTVIERDPGVIALFREHILPAFENAEKVTVVQEDAYEYAAHMSGEGYDYAYVDIWHDVLDGVEMYLKMKRLENLSPGTRFLYWIETSMLCWLRGMALMEIAEKKDGPMLEAIGPVKGLEDLKRALSQEGLRRLAPRIPLEVTRRD